jgi:hypothetical protein
LNTNILVNIQAIGARGNDQVTPTLWATLVPDGSATTPLAMPNPVIMEQGTDLIAVPFGSEPASAPAAMAGQLPTTGGISSPSTAPSANKIAVRAQNANLGQVRVDSAMAVQDGWLLIREDNNGVPGRTLGFAPVHQGLNTNILVNIQAIGAGGNDQVTPTLWATLVPDGSATTPLATPNPVIMEQGTDLIAVPFGS